MSEWICGLSTVDWLDTALSERKTVRSKFSNDGHRLTLGLDGLKFK